MKAVRVECDMREARFFSRGGRILVRVHRGEADTDEQWLALVDHFCGIYGVARTKH